MAERDSFRHSIAQVVIGTAVIGLFLFALLEVFANLGFWADLLHSLPQRPASWDFKAGVGTGDVVVINTALLLLVATLNVALAALLIKDRDTVSGSVDAFGWASVAFVVGVGAAAVSVALTATRLFNEPAIFVVLLFVAAMTIGLTASISLNGGVQQLRLNVADLRRRLDSLEDALDSVGARAHRVARPWISARQAYASSTKGLLWIAVLGLANLALLIWVLGYSNGVTPGAHTQSKTDWVGEGLGAFSLYFTTICLYAFFAALRLAVDYCVARSWTARATAARWLYWFLAAGLPLYLLAGTPAKHYPTLLLAVIVLSLPQLIVWLWGAFAERRSSRGGSGVLTRGYASLLGFVGGLLKSQVRNLAKQLASEEDRLDAQIAEVNVVQRPRATWSKPPRIRLSARGAKGR